MNSILTFKVTYLQQLKMLSYTIITTFLFFIVWIYFLHNSLEGYPFWVALVVLFIIGILPVTILHVQYWLVNKKSVLTIDINDNTIQYQSGSENFKFSAEDILKITLYTSYGRNTGWYTFSGYRYFKINLKNSTEIIITCLMVNDIEYLIKSQLRANIDKEFRIICFLS